MIKKILIVIGCIIPNLVFAQSINSVNTQGYFNFHGGSLPINAKTIINVDGIDYVIGDLIKTINEGFGNISNLETQINQAANDANTALGLANQAQTTANNAVPTSKIGQAGWVAGLDTNKNITNSVIGNVASGVADSSGDLVSDIATIAKEAQTTSTNAIPLAQKGTAEGVATTDVNNMMNMSVSGDSSSSPVVSTNSNTQRTLSDRFSDIINIKDYGVLLNGNASDETGINTAFNGNTNKKLISIPAGTWPSQTWIPDNTANTKFVNVDGFLNSPPNTSYTAYGINVGVYNFGSGVTSVTHGGQYFPNSVMTSRVSTGTTDTSYDPMVSHRQVLDGPNNNHEGNNTEQNITIVTPNSSGYSTNVSDKLYSLGHNYYGSFDVNHWSRTDVYGTNWVWDHIQELGESVTYFCNSGTSDSTYCTAHYINEIDFGGYGSDDPQAEYNPDKATRTAYLLSTNTIASQNTTRSAWTANTSFWKYQQVVVKDSSNKPWIFYALPSGYTVGGSGNTSSAISGSVSPSWTFNKGDTIIDGGLTWYCEGPFTYDVGALIKVSGGNNPSTGYIERIGTIMEEHTDYIYNAIFDMSVASFDPSVPYKIFGRLQKDMYFDLTADGTQSGQNNHLLGYDSSVKSLSYKINGKIVNSIDDNGNVTFGSNSSGAVGLQVGSQVTSNPAFIDFFANGNKNASARILSSSSGLSFLYNDATFQQAVTIGTSLYLGSMSKSAILALASPKEGQKVFDKDDHIEVTYRCPQGSNCGWYDSNNNNISIITSISNEGLTSSGSSITDSLKLTAITNTITTSNSGTGVQLPNSFIGTNVVILNRSANPINVYPESSTIQIENLGNGNAQDLEPNSSITFIKTSSTEWRIK